VYVQYIVVCFVGSLSRFWHWLLTAAEAASLPPPLVLASAVLGMLLLVLGSELAGSRETWRREEADAAAAFAHGSFAPLIDPVHSEAWACVCLNACTSPRLLQKVRILLLGLLGTAMDTPRDLETAFMF
jgi:hypothetical protein